MREIELSLFKNMLVVADTCSVEIFVGAEEGKSYWGRTARSLS
jgi:hypothetical protein